jgi:hypothetical protein
MMVSLQARDSSLVTAFQALHWALNASATRFQNFVGHGLGGLAVQDFFLELDLFGELDGEELLRRAFGFIAAHGP